MTHPPSLNALRAHAQMMAIFAALGIPVSTAVVIDKTGEPDHARAIWQSALAQPRRVTAAHLHLPFEEEPKK